MIPNLTVALKIFLIISVSIAICEQSFSKLKLIKTYLCSTMNQARLNGLALLSIERDVTNDTDFFDIIKKFASIKARKIKIKIFKIKGRESNKMKKNINFVFV